MPASSPSVEIEIDDRVIRVSNPDRVYFPARGETKLDLVEYYLAVGPGIVNALFERPCMLHRFPTGLSGEKVHQKRLPSGAPDWVQTVQLYFPRWGRTADELCVTELGSVIWAVQMSTVEFHPWNSRREDPEKPDEWRIDLDPGDECTYDTVQRVAHVAHEPRTPVTILRAYCEEMVDGVAEPSLERLASLHDEVLRLGTIVDDLETLASAEAAGLRLERTLVGLDRVAAAAAELLEPRFAAAELELELELAPVEVEGDPGRLGQVVTNLLTNGLKFTPPGGRVTLAVAPRGELARLSVTDTGPGIPAEELPHVFERFWRGSRAAAVGGSGIGLAVVSELVRAHSGRVEVESTIGEGTTFTVLLPRARKPHV